MKLNLLKNALKETKSKKKELASKVNSDSGYIPNSELERVKIEEYKRKEDENRKRKRQLLLEIQKKSGKESVHGITRTKDSNSTESKVGKEGAPLSVNDDMEPPMKRQKRMLEDNDSVDTLSNVIPEPLQVMKMLRQLKEPITVFGESDLERWTRLKIVEKKQSELVNEQQNIFQKNLMEEEVARQERQSLLRSSSISKEDTESTINLSEPLPDFETFNKSMEEYVLYMLQRLCEEWRLFLVQRPESEQKSAIGKREFGNWKQSTQYLIPLYQKLKSKTLDQSQLKFFTKIFSYVAQKEYVLANDQYLQLAIGNVAWPMGVENIGIHARSSREKISSVKIAHVLNDDTQRKYIQCVKRLITFAQKKYPTIPSKMVA